jgi:Ca2+-binding RTX toxin-like protein
MIGGHNVAGGVDELSAPQVVATLNPPMNDLMDGGMGDDALAGDNAAIWRRGDDRSPRFRQLTSGTLYTVTDSAVTANVGPAPENDPNGAVGRDITLLDHSTTTPAGRFGADLMAGGANNDVLFGELGNDLMQGDGFIGADDGNPGSITHQVDVVDSGSNPDTDETLYFNVPEASTDGDDYMEGNGGDDLMYGGLGQDDMVGGNSALFGLTSAALRPDGADRIFGGAGTRITRNVDVSGGDPFFAERHARDADAIVGDNGNIYRAVSGGAFPTFNYDVNGLASEGYAATRRIVPRAIELIDYTPGGPDVTPAVEAGPANVAINPATGVRDVGAPDELHGESGDDFMYGMVGGDVMYGDAQDDNMVAGYDADWVSGGTGDDGILGDDGVVFASRNGTYGEPLYGVAGFASTDLNKLISIPGQTTNALTNVSGLLKYTADLTPDNLQPNLNPASPDTMFRPLYANDIVYGGLGHDAIHAGAGDDAVSGAEAPVVSYTNNYDKATGAQLNATPLQSDFSHPVNPGNVLGYDPATTKLAQYDANDALRKVLFDPTNGSLWKGAPAGGLEWLLNFDSSEGPTDTKWIVGQTRFAGVATDGDDRIFADLGNDWAVGGTGRDVMYTGWGDDVMNMDDVLNSNGGLNDVTDTNPSWEDLGFAGAGVDVLIMNTNGDRGFDWTGEFNTFRTPYSQFGAVSVSRFLIPQLPQFLYDLSKSNGADQTLAAKYGNPARNGEPFGELGLILQEDAAWQAQSGSPRDPQGGNLPGSKVDVKNNPGTSGQQTIYSTAVGGASGRNRPFLTDEQLAPIVAQAKRFWAAVLGPEGAAMLKNLQVVIGDLPGAKLGALVGGVIVIDGTAAGRGWFVDSTPWESSEFVARKGSMTLAAPNASPAFGRMDLLSVVMHELGHALGLDHEPDGVMSETLRPGKRMMPEAAALPPAKVSKGSWFLSRSHSR